MGIFGIGIDLVKNDRIRKILLSSYAERFLVKVLHRSELEEIKAKEQIEQRVIYLASRWSYKEACVKACGRRELLFPKMSLYKDNLGKPFIRFEDFNRELLENTLGIKKTHVSLSHEDEHSIAFVVMEN